MTLDFANLMTVAALGLLIVLRVDARRFGAADFDDETAVDTVRVWTRRLTWYGLGIVLVFAAYFVFPQPESVLHLRIGDERAFALMAGLTLAMLGVGAAVLYAWWRFGAVKLPSGRVYPVGLLNSVATAFIDEAAFRGILLGLLLFSNWPPIYAVAFQAVAYALATRLGGAGRPSSLLVVWLVASVGLAFYSASFGSYEKTWGTLSAVVVTLVWLWLGGAALLFGAEINAELEGADQDFPDPGEAPTGRRE